MKDDELEVVKGKIKLLEDELDENDTRDLDEKQTVSARIITVGSGYIELSVIS